MEIQHQFPDFRYAFYDQHGMSLPDDFMEGVPSPADHAREEALELIRSVAIEKPAWIEESEAEAREFVAQFGLHPDAPVVLLGEGEGLEEKDPWNSPLTVGMYDNDTNIVFFRMLKLIQFQDGDNSKVTRAMVHELVHAAEEHSGLVVGRLQGAGVLALTEEGLSRRNLALDMRSGKFYEEGLAEFMAGLYYRRQQNPDAPLVSVIDRPSLKLPEHYTYNNSNMVSGPDAYGMELLAWGLERKGIMTADDFIRNMLASRHRETRAAASRLHARSINQLEPGLYVELRDTKRGYESWRNALKRIHEVVTSP